MLDFRNKTVNQLKDLLSYHTKHSSTSDYFARREYEAAAAEMNSRISAKALQVPANLTQAQINRDKELSEYRRQTREESAMRQSAGLEAPDEI